jgi:hypothetical protein
LNKVEIYLLTPWRRVLLEKLTSFQLVKKFPAYYGTQKYTLHTQPILILLEFITQTILVEEYKTKV